MIASGPNRRRVEVVAIAQPLCDIEEVLHQRRVLGVVDFRSAQCGEHAPAFLANVSRLMGSVVHVDHVGLSVTAGLALRDIMIARTSRDAVRPIRGAPAAG
jgi:hypothetical protein